MGVNILIGATGSVATIKLPVLIKEIKEKIKEANIKVIVTKAAKRFVFCEAKEELEEFELPCEFYSDSDEWNAWNKRGDPILHIDLGKWADVFLIAPLDANTLAKISNGICDNLLTCTVRAWELTKPLIFCPAMNTKMYIHPLTEQQIGTLVKWGYNHIPVIEKTLVCGDTGIGAMAEISKIVEVLRINILILKQTSTA